MFCSSVKGGTFVLGSTKFNKMLWFTQKLENLIDKNPVTNELPSLFIRGFQIL